MWASTWMDPRHRTTPSLAILLGPTQPARPPSPGPLVGVLINDAPDNIIGGSNLADRNIISGNSVVGVYIALAGATGNVVQNNYIGTDVSGLAGIPNGVDGIYINGAPNNLIGGTAAGTGNLISANLSAGIQIFGAGATNNQIFRNRLGLDANGRLTLPNGVTGIFSQISIQANDFGFSTVNQNLGQILPLQSPTSIGGRHHRGEHRGQVDGAPEDLKCTPSLEGPPPALETEDPDRLGCPRPPQRKTGTGVIAEDPGIG